MKERATSKKRISSIWSHFTVDNTDDKASCNFCKSTFAYYRGTTSNLWKHLLKVHNIEKSEKDGTELIARQQKATRNSGSNTTGNVPQVAQSIPQAEKVHSFLTLIGKEIVDGQCQLKFAETVEPQVTQVIAVAAAAESDYCLPDSVPVVAEIDAETANVASPATQEQSKNQENVTIINNLSQLLEKEITTSTQRVPHIIGCKRKRGGGYTTADRAKKLHEYERRQTEAQESMAASLALVAKSLANASESFIDYINSLKNK